jgi:hypothetical protein
MLESELLDALPQKDVNVFLHKSEEITSHPLQQTVTVRMKRARPDCGLPFLQALLDPLYQL